MDGHARLQGVGVGQAIVALVRSRDGRQHRLAHRALPPVRQLRLHRGCGHRCDVECHGRSRLHSIDDHLRHCPSLEYAAQTEFR